MPSILKRRKEGKIMSTSRAFQLIQTRALGGLQRARNRNIDLDAIGQRLDKDLENDSTYKREVYLHSKAIRYYFLSSQSNLFERDLEVFSDILISAEKDHDLSTIISIIDRLFTVTQNQKNDFRNKQALEELKGIGLNVSEHENIIHGGDETLELAHEYYFLSKIHQLTENELNSLENILVIAQENRILSVILGIIDEIILVNRSTAYPLSDERSKRKALHKLHEQGLDEVFNLQAKALRIKAWWQILCLIFWTIFRPLGTLGYWIDSIEVKDPVVARRIARFVPSQCPFERDIVLFGRTVAHIPPMCKLNPLYDELVGLRFRALCFLADECGEDISALI